MRLSEKERLRIIPAKNAFELYAEYEAKNEKSEEFMKKALALFGPLFIGSLVLGWAMPFNVAIRIGSFSFVALFISAFISVRIYGDADYLKAEAKRLYGTNSEEYW